MKNFLESNSGKLAFFKDIKAAKIAFKELEQNKYIRYDDLPLKSKNGNSKQVEFVSNMYEVNHKRVIQCNIRDITERKEAEKALRKNEVRYHSLFMNMLEGLAYCRMIFVDGQPQDFIHLEVNNAFKSLTGLKNVVGRRISEVIPGIRESDPLWIETLGRVALTGKSEIFEIYIEALHDWFQMSVYCPQKEYFVVVFDVITRRKQAAAALQASEAKFRSYIENAPLGVFVVDQYGKYVEVNEAAAEMLGYTKTELLQLSISDVLAPQSLEIGLQLFMKIVNEGSASEELLFCHKDNTQFWSTLLAVRLGSDRFMSFCQDITVRKKAEERLKILSSAVEQTADSVFITDHEGVIEYVNTAFERLTGYSKEEAIGKTQRILKLNTADLKEDEQIWKIIRAGKVFQGDLISREKNGDLFYEKQTITPIMDENGRITQFVSTGKDITEQNQREREMKAIVDVSSTLRVAKTLEEMLNLLLEKTLKVMNIKQGAIWLYFAEENELRPVVMSEWNMEGDHIIPPEKPGQGINGRVFLDNKPYNSRELRTDKNLPEETRQFIPPGVGGLTFPICSGDDVIGTFNINVSLPRVINPGEVRVVSALAELAGNAIQRMRLFEKTKRDALRFAALHAIDMSINTGDTLETILNFLLDKVVELLKVSASDILLFNSFSQTLEYSASKGFRTKSIQKSRLRLGEGFAGQVAFERKMIDIPDLKEVKSKNSRTEVIEIEEFNSYFGVPLISKGKMIGVLEIFNRSTFTPDSEWMDFLQAIASQAAIAIDSATLFNDLQHSNVNILQAYDKTIEGWSKAMDLRDHQTGDHTFRTTELCCKTCKGSGHERKGYCTPSTRRFTARYRKNRHS